MKKILLFLIAGILLANPVFAEGISHKVSFHKPVMVCGDSRNSEAYLRLSNGNWDKAIVILSTDKYLASRTTVKPTDPSKISFKNLTSGTSYSLEVKTFLEGKKRGLKTFEFKTIKCPVIFSGAYSA